jgi:hypothetical protein
VTGYFARKTTKLGVIPFTCGESSLPWAQAAESTSAPAAVVRADGLATYRNDSNEYIISFQNNLDILATGSITITMERANSAAGITIAENFRGGNCWHWHTTTVTGELKVEVLDSITKPPPFYHNAASPTWNGSSADENLVGFLISGFDAIPASSTIAFTCLF